MAANRGLGQLVDAAAATSAAPHPAEIASSHKRARAVIIAATTHRQHCITGAKKFGLHDGALRRFSFQGGYHRC